MSALQDLRTLLGWGREEVSRRTGLALTTIINIEKGANFNSESAKAIATGLHITFSNALALCASTLSGDELKTLASSIPGGINHEGIEALPDARRNPRVRVQNEGARTGAKVSRIRKPSFKA